MEVLLGSPPPPPPDNVPDLEETKGDKDGKFLSVAEQLAKHRASPFCSSCHNVIDPIGLSLDNFDVTGSWRIKDRGVPVNTAGELYDGTKINGAADLRAALIARSDVVMTHFTEHADVVRARPPRGVLRHADDPPDRPGRQSERLPDVVADSRRGQERAVPERDGRSDGRRQVG